MGKILVAKAGPLEGSRYAIAGRTLIGRDPESDIQVVDVAASRKHACVLEQDDGSVIVRDLGSHNGTWLRGERLRESLLEPGDEITIGDSTFEYRTDGRDADSTPTQEIELKLVSGPAQARTATVSPAELDAVLAAHRAAEAAKDAAPAACCNDPLAERARQEGWGFCPACGSKRVR